MKYLDTTSLFATIDHVSEALLFGMEIDQKEKTDIARFIAGRQGMDNAYANTFAPTEKDMKGDFLLLTGEKIRSRVGKCHMAGEEAGRILRKLGVKNSMVGTALDAADSGLRKQIERVLQDPHSEFGMYCCKSCSCGLWLNLSSGGPYSDGQMVKAGLNLLKRYRDNKGRWKGFPYYYVLHILNELESRLAFDEMRYAAPLIEKNLKKNKTEVSKYDVRRNFIREQILKKVGSN